MILGSHELLQEQAGPEGDGADDGTRTVAYQRDVTIYHSVQFRQVDSQNCLKIETIIIEKIVSTLRIKLNNCLKVLAVHKCYYDTEQVRI